MRGRHAILAVSLSLFCVGGYYAYLNTRPVQTGPSERTIPLAKSARSSATAAANSVPSEASGTPRNPVVMWDAPVNVVPEPTMDVVPNQPVQPPKGREATLDAKSFAKLPDLQRGDTIAIPLPGGEQLTGRINLVQPDEGGWVRIGGQLTGHDAGSFIFNGNGEQVFATVVREDKQVAYEVTGNGEKTVIEEKPLDEVVCQPIPPSNEPERALFSRAAQQAPPLLSSRPQATAVVYLDFDGETVTDPSWNSGNTIVAAAANLTNAEISLIWERVKEDYWAFNVDITTDLTRYNSAPVGRRMRCIVTPTNTAAPGAGGVAYVNSFSRSGTNFSSTIPCWVFNGGVVGAAEAVSHEVGHTLGLSHDGRTTPAEGYYAGHGSGAVGWAPIMGVGYYKQLTQWSKGEYANANNTQDDIAIISGTANGFGFVTDEAGNTRQTAANLNAPGGTVNQAGVITQSTDSDFYVINVGAGTVNLTATPATTGANVDILLELQDATGAVLTTANPDTAINATLSRSVTAGVYYLKVQGTGRGNPLTDGYTSYGSIGAYTLGGSIPGGSAVLTPVVTSGSSASGLVGQPFSYQIVATNAPGSYGATGLPAGLAVNTTTGLISGTPTTAGASNVTLSAQNTAGTGTANLALTVSGSVANDFANTAAITINASGAASTYPSTINVSGVTGSVTKVTAKLTNLRHTYPDDLDVLLVGPGGQKIMLMSDAGGGGDVNNVTLTFSDTAAAALPDSTQIVSGTYRAGNNQAGETLPTPAPAGPYGTALSAFNGIDPNGAWRLYVLDDASGDSGSIAGGWSLNFTTASPIASNRRILWSQPDGTATIWGLDSRNGYTRQYTAYGPYEGWAPSQFSGSAEGGGRLTWRSASGGSWVWTLDGNNEVTAETVSGE